MGNIKTLFDKEGRRYYPVTGTKAVFDPQGRDLEERLAIYPEREELSNVLARPVGYETEQPELEYPRLFIDQWERACRFDGVDHYFGRYNWDTGYFELNGITDITYDEALMIWARSEHGLLSNVSDYVNCYKFGGGAGNGYNAYSDCRTYFPIISGTGYTAPSLVNAFYGNTVVEVLNFVGGYGNSLSNIPRLFNAFANCKSLKRILCDIGYPMVNDSTFYNCSSLEYISITAYIDNSTFNFQWSPKLSKKSLELFVSRAVFENTDTGHEKTLTFIAHPDVYAKLTDENNVEWHRVLTDAVAKNITFATV